jgi:hypothetical protein
MEADWSAEIGAGLPEIHAPWEGFVDLRRDPAALQAISEAASFPALARALAIMNGEDSAVFTTKSDVWNTAADEIDRYEFDALASDARVGLTSYIDVLERSTEHLISYDFHERRAKQLTAALRTAPMRNGRVDLVIRAAIVDGRDGFGITLYAAGCGSDTAAALANWESVLIAAVLATMKAAGPNPPPAHLAGE